MPATQFLSRRPDQVHSMNSTPDRRDGEVQVFHQQVANRFHELAAADSTELLSMPWLQKLLDAFLCCHEEFRVIVFNNKAYLSKPPLDRCVSEFFERSVKALDVCNAIRDGIEQIRQWQKQLEIVLCALDNQRSIGEGQLRRAKKALMDLAIGMLDEKESNALSNWNRSFRRNSNSPRKHRPSGHFRSLSWSVSRNWSAARQLQAIGNNLVVPRANEIISTNGLSLAVFTMSYVLLFVMWVLVAAIPCQDRGLQMHIGVAKQFLWAEPILSLHERILEESKKRDRKNICGLLKEIHGVEKCGRRLNELSDSLQFPLTDMMEGEVRHRVEEVGKVYETLKDGLDPLECKIKEVFRRIVRSRTEGLNPVASSDGS